MRDVVVLTSKM